MENAIAQVFDGGEIVLSESFALTEALTINKDITIKGDATITTNGIPGALMVTSGTLTLGEGVVVNTNSRGEITAKNGGKVVIDGATISSTCSTYTAVWADGAGSSVEIKSGSVSGTDSSAVCASNGAVVTISGGTVSSVDYGTCYSYAGGKIIVTGDAVVTSTNNWAMIAASGGEFEIQGGTLDWVIAHGSNTAQGTISGGTVTAKVAARNGATITITGGTVNGAFEESAGGNLVVTGGTFANDPTSYVDTGYTVTGTDPYVVTPNS